MASAAFGKNICVYSMDKEDYINELYISACKNPREQRICLAKAGKKYYAVLTSDTQEILPFIKEKLIEEVNTSSSRSSPPYSKEKAIHRSVRTASTTRITTR